MTQKITITTSNGSILNDNSKLIINQRLNLVIKLAGGDQDFKDHDTVTVTSNANWATINNGNGIKVNIDKKDNKQASIKDVILNIDSSSNNVGRNIEITVQTTNNGYKKEPFNYTVTDLDLDSLKLVFEKNYLKTPTQNNNPTNGDSGNLINTLVSATVKDSSGVAMPNFSITIKRDFQDQLSQFYFLDKENKPITVNTNSKGEETEFTLISDENGSIIFSAYPKINTSAVLGLQSLPDGLPISQNSDGLLFVLSGEPDDYHNLLPAPQIEELSDENILTVKPGTSQFHVEVINPNTSNTYYLLFFVNGKYVGEANEITGNNNIPDTFISKLPYQVFPIAKNNLFSYAQATREGSVSYSLELPVTYNGGSANKPDSSITRELVAPILYSSKGIAPPNLPINQYDTINYPDIEDYITNGGTALYVVIDVDPNDPHKISYGDTVYVDIYINSANRGSQHKSYPLTILKEKSTVFLSIPYGPIVDNDAENNHSGSFYIEYYILDTVNNIRSKSSQIWSGFIETARPGLPNG
ncbi:hypothetical protein [Xenorhabdus sp. KJ12.1]|uniref:hypothetical protein n=1 Tax=Xenorhabdus sp. KJ12.1 TaxID=1851571 RepID=UPI000C03B4AD|nr:hypothetical protein [Xenorhabdus sp. KJ12.1]PHM72026.1 hypothetical protein Xekj_00816 [Xenorhabdus sp. KJ12.1]